MEEELELYKTYFQKSQSYYIDKLVKYKEGQKLSFNAFACFLGLFWFMYRKLYVEFILILITAFAIGILETLILVNTVEYSTARAIMTFTEIVMAFTIGMYSNFLYIRKAEKAVANAQNKYKDTEAQKRYLKKKGGVSYSFLIIFVIIIFCFYYYNNYVISSNN